MMIAQDVDLVTIQKLTGYSTKELTDYSSRYYEIELYDAQIAPIA